MNAKVKLILLPMVILIVLSLTSLKSVSAAEEIKSDVFLHLERTIREEGFHKTLTLDIQADGKVVYDLSKANGPFIKSLSRQDMAAISQAVTRSGVVSSPVAERYDGKSTHYQFGKLELAIGAERINSVLRADIEAHRNLWLDIEMIVRTHEWVCPSPDALYALKTKADWCKADHISVHERCARSPKLYGCKALLDSNAGQSRTRNPDELVFLFRRGGDSYPAYEISVYQDGYMEYRGYKGTEVATVGKASAVISSQQLQNLVLIGTQMVRSKASPDIYGGPYSGSVFVRFNGDARASDVMDSVFIDEMELITNTRQWRCHSEEGEPLLNEVLNVCSNEEQGLSEYVKYKTNHQ